jgi:hypothetical protein
MQPVVFELADGVTAAKNSVIPALAVVKTHISTRAIILMKL